jgi:hypothetical protein
MNNLEIVTSQEYQDLLSKLNPSMSFEPEMVDINKMIEFFKFQSNPDDKVSYMEEHMVTYEVLKNTHFFIEFKNLMLVGLYTNTIGKDYFILVEKDGTINFIGDTVINWTNYEELYFDKELVFEFQTACHYQYEIPTITWMDKTIKMGRTITPDDFNNDKAYQSYLKSDMLYDTYRYLKDNSAKGYNFKKLRMDIRGLAQSKGAVAYYIDEQFKLIDCILDYRFFTDVNPKKVKGFFDLDIEYEYSEDDVINITHYKASKPSIFNIFGLFSGFKERLRLYTVFLRILPFLAWMHSYIFFVKITNGGRRFK